MTTDSSIPLVHAFRQPPDLAQVLRRLASRPHLVALDSSQRHSTLGRYSYVAVDPVDWISAAGAVHDPSILAPLQDVLTSKATAFVPDLPPFQGGWMGLLGYELNNCFERIPAPAIDEFQIPKLAMGFYDVVLAWDHDRDCAWIVSQGFSRNRSTDRRAVARQRLDQMIAWLNEPVLEHPTAHRQLQPATIETPQMSTPIPNVFSNFCRSTYCDMIAAAVERIHAGEVFQVNLSQRLLRRWDGDPISLFLKLRRTTPATFSAFIDLGHAQLVSVSPEQFLRVRNRHVEARPIKGTRRGMPLPEADLYSQLDLTESYKDQAENTMIVDLLRNDLSRVCDDDSIHVSTLCGLESYGYVHHLVSVVEGRLAWPHAMLDLIPAAFPCGSVTGAPKIRAMELIASLEGVARGAYCGSIGFLGVNGNMDLNVLIRTITLAGGWCQMQVGGGIVADSIPDQEYSETWHKALGMLRAFGNV